VCDAERTGGRHDETNASRFSQLFANAHTDYNKQHKGGSEPRVVSVSAALLRAVI